MAGDKPKPAEMCYDGCGMTREKLVQSFIDVLSMTREGAESRYDELAAKWRELQAWRHE